MNSQLSQEEDGSYLQLPTTEWDDKKQNGTTGKLASPSMLSVSMPNIAVGLHQSSHLLLDCDEDMHVH